MNFVTQKWGLGVLAAAGLLAACGARSLSPGVVNSNAMATRAMAPAAHRHDCGLAQQPLPGTYLLMQSQGWLAGTKYYSSSGVWLYGTVWPTTEPSPSSQPRPPRTPVYVYVGQYSFPKFHAHGCAYFVTSQDEKPIAGDGNATLDGSPWFEHSAVTMHAMSGGTLHATGRFDAQSGVAAFSLVGGRGVVEDRGTATFTQRISTVDLGSLVGARAAAPVPNYAFTCDPAHYVYKTVQVAKPGTARGFGFDPRSTAVTYVEHFGFCGVDNSYLTPSDVTSTQSYTFAHGAITYRLAATFGTSVAWANNPDVAVWEEAHRYDGTRDERADIHLAVVRVR